MASKSFWKMLPKWLLAGTVAVPLLLSQGSGHLSVGQVHKAVGKRNAALQVKIPVSVDPGFHVNSDKPAEDYLIPLKLTFDKASTGALEAGAVVYPKPGLEKYDFEDKPLSVFTGNFELTANFKVAATAPAGPGVATGKLKYQACNNSTCFPPKTVEVAVPYSVQ